MSALPALREPQPAPTPALRDLYAAVLPAQGHYALFLANDKRHLWAASIDELATKTERLGNTQGIYFATASFKAPTNRTAANVLHRRSICFDIDAGPEKVAKHGDKVYATQVDAYRALIAWCGSTHAKPAYVLSSGAGLHVYFLLDRDLTPAEWKLLAEAMKARALADGLRIDASVTADAARILRPPGTLHPNGERVRILAATPAVYAPDALRALFPVAAPRRERSINDDVLDAPVGPPKSLTQVLKQCAAMAHVARLRGDVAEPYWRAMLGIVKFTVEGASAAHALSEGHPEYDPARTQAKLDRWTAGPTTCATFEVENPQACASCKHRGKVKSPIALGAVVGADPVAPPPAAESAHLVEALAKMNVIYFVSPDGAGHPTIWMVTIDPESGAWRCVPLTRAEFILMYENQFVDVPRADGGTTRTSLAQWWLKQANRRAYTGMALLPEGPVPAGIFNLWRGFSVQPVKGDVAPMLAHVHMLCSGDAKLVGYVLGWLAYCVQRPGQRPEVALVLRGGQGTGKGTLFRVQARFFGSHGLHLTQPAHLTGNFNGHLRLALFVFVDEGFWAGDKAAEGVLKGHITEPTITIEMKGREVYTAHNKMKIAIASNGAWVIPAGNDERRYCVIDVPTTKAGDHPYFKKLHAWLLDGGDSHWLAYLLAHDLSEFDPRLAPSTAALDRQKLESMPPLDRWLMEALDQGTALAGHGDWLDDGIQVVCTAAVADYAEYCKRAGSRYTLADARVVGDRLRKVFGCGASCTVQSGAFRRKAWALPGLPDARARAAVAFGLKHYTWGQS